jgi:MraZ protein
MHNFYGEFEATIDSKGRFLLPGGLKKQLPEAEKSYMISRGFEKCLTLYTLESWNGIMEKINKLNDFDPKVRTFRRLFTGGATVVELDSANRVLIPQSLKEFAGIGKDIILNAANGKFEIWDASNYNNLFTEISAQDFSDLAKDVMSLD